MSVVAAALRELIALGVSGEALIAAVERIEAAAVVERANSVVEAVEIATQRADNEYLAQNAPTYAERKRAKDRERQRVLRAAQRQSRDPAINRAMSRDPAINRAMSPATEGTNRATAGDAPHAGAQVVIPSLPSLRSEEVVVGGVGKAREPVSDDWPDGKASDHADLLVQTVASPWLDPSKSPDLVTTRGRVAAWKRAGASWEHDVLPVVSGLCANRRSRVASWKFFDDAIARSIAENRQALEIPEAGSVVPFRGGAPPGGSFADRIAAENAEARRRALES